MHADPIDRDFQVFCRSRDPAALAAVFDAAAPRLLLVAMHLCRDAATAEDLVQTVFLQVLRDVDRFDRRRPLMPWLLGMLEHRASDLRSRAHVRRERAADTAAVAGGTSPEHAAAANEVRERVAEALAGMPRDYRDVLALRLVHGLSAVDIAHAHGLPPATVRTRLRRGLELLRGALPRGLATRGLIALLAAELTFARDGLAAVRAKVLAAAAAGTGVATIALGWWLMLAATLLLAAGGWWWLAPSPSVATRSEAGAAPVVVANEASDSEQPRVGVSGATATEPVAQRTAVADPRTTTIRGRVVDASSGAPLAGVVATVRTYHYAGHPFEADWKDPEPQASAADGTFAVRFVPSRHRGVELGVTSAGYVDEDLSWEPLREGVEVDAGDVQLRPGTPVRLRVLHDGKPLAGVPVFANPAPDGNRPNGVRGFGPTDADGVVDLGTCEPGPWWHDLRTALVGCEARFDVPLQRAPHVVAVELHDPPREHSISGVLLDTTGAPVPGIVLGIPWPGGTLPAITRADGRFLWAVLVPPHASVHEHIELPRDQRGGLEWIHDGGDVAWGTHDLRLVVRRRAPATLRLEVVDASTQQAVEAFGATCKAEPGSCSAERRRVAVEHHDGGVATFEVAPGDWFASVFAEPPYAESAELSVTLVEGRTTTLRVPLRPPAALDVDVVDAGTGDPLEGIEVALMKAVPAASEREIPSEWYQSFRANAETTGGRGKGAVIVLARGVSDARGHLALRAPSDVSGLVLVAGGPRCIASEHHDVVLPSNGARTTIRVVSAGIVRGVVVPRTFVERFGPAPEQLAEAAANRRIQWTDADELAHDYPLVMLRPSGGAPRTAFQAHTAADGSFTIGGVTTGRYTVHVEDRIGNAKNDLTLATIDVDPAHPGEPLTLDVSVLVPVRCTVRYFVDGAPAKGEGGLARILDSGVQEVTFPLAAGGSGTTPWLLPGTYVPFVVGDGGRVEHVFGTERLIVPVGGTATIDATFALQRRVVTVSIVEANGEPARDVFVWTDAIDPPGLGRAWWLPRRTDADGRLLFAAAPPGRLQLHAFGRDQDLRDVNTEPALLLGDVAADANAATFRMPPR